MKRLKTPGRPDLHPENRTSFAATYGPWAVITGASSGIGEALAGASARRGLDLVLVARRTDRLEAVAARLGAAHHIETRVVTADLRHDTDRLLASTDDLDVGLLVAAAGFGTSGDLLDGDLGRELDMLSVNCAGPLALSWHYGRRFVARAASAGDGRPRRGGIVLLSSILAYQGQPHAAHYAATKAYIHTLGEGLHRELAPHHVDVLATAPGPVASEFADRADMRMGRALDPAAIADPILDALAHGRATNLPGGLSRLLRSSIAPLPRTLRSRVMGAVMAGMTGHHDAAPPDSPGPRRRARRAAAAPRSR